MGSQLCLARDEKDGPWIGWERGPLSVDLTSNTGSVMACVIGGGDARPSDKMNSRGDETVIG